MKIIKTKSGNKYQVGIWINGKYIRRTFPRIADCKQWKAEQLSNRAKLEIYGDLKLNEKITLSNYCKNWLKTKLAQGIAQSSYRNYESNIRIHFEPFFKNMVLQSIRKHDVERFQIDLKQNHNPKGVNLIIITLKSVFKEAIKDGYLLKSPCEYIRSLKADKKHEVYWTKPEIDQFLKANYSHELYDLFLVAMNTGMRKGELAGLCWDRVDFSTNSIAITRTRDRRELKERTKTNIIRILPMNEIVKPTLLKLFKQRTDSNFVFLDADRNPINPHHLYRQFCQAQKRAGLNRQIRFHDLRHTFASQYVINSGSIYDLQKFLGHTDISMTTRYAHHSMEYLQAAMKGFSLGETQNTDAIESTVIPFISDSKNTNQGNVLNTFRTL